MGELTSYKYYKSHNSGIYWRIYRFFLIDSKRNIFLNSSLYSVVTLVTWVLIVIIVVYSIISLKVVTSNKKIFQELQDEVEKKIPRKKSIVNIKPAYNCIHKHLQQRNIFQEKTEKMLRKEHLELEILNSRINCINKLLKPEAQTEWRRSRSPKVYHRPINTTTTK